MAKWDSKRKLRRNRLLIACYTSQPGLSLREIGEIFNVTPGRVWQLVREAEKKQGRKIVRKAR